MLFKLFDGIKFVISISLIQIGKQIHQCVIKYEKNVIRIIFDETKMLSNYFFLLFFFFFA